MGWLTSSPWLLGPSVPSSISLNAFPTTSAFPNHGPRVRVCHSPSRRCCLTYIAHVTVSSCLCQLSCAFTLTHSLHPFSASGDVRSSDTDGQLSAYCGGSAMGLRGARTTRPCLCVTEGFLSVTVCVSLSVCHCMGVQEFSKQAGLRRVVMVWFRNDLRVHDNEALFAANHDGVAVLPVYCFDPRDYGMPPALPTRAPSGPQCFWPTRVPCALASVCLPLGLGLCNPASVLSTRPPERPKMRRACPSRTMLVTLPLSLWHK